MSGKDRLDLLHRITTNDILALREGTVAGTLFLTDKARLIDLAFCATEGETLTLLQSRECESAVRDLVERYTILEDVRVQPVADERSILSLVGPGAIAAGGLTLGNTLVPNSCLRRTFPFGEGLVVAIKSSRWQMVHLVVGSDLAAGAWEWLAAVCAREGIPPLGTRAFELYRLTSGMPAAGAEIAPAYNPYDAGLVEFVSFTKGCYIGQEVVARIDTYGKQKRTLAALLLDGPASGEKLPLAVMHEGKACGQMTSVADYPLNGKYPGLAVLPMGLAGGGKRVDVLAHGTSISGTIYSLPAVME